MMSSADTTGLVILDENGTGELDRLAQAGDPDSSGFTFTQSVWDFSRTFVH
jgi:hypothetical protein